MTASTYCADRSIEPVHVHTSSYHRQFLEESKLPSRCFPSYGSVESEDMAHHLTGLFLLIYVYSTLGRG